MLSDIKPNLSRVALMFNPSTAPFYDAYLQAFDASHERRLVEVQAARVRSVAEIEMVIAKLGREPGSGLIVGADSSSSLCAEPSQKRRLSIGCRSFPPIGNSSPREV